ncbi:alpha-ketoglutarate-dependent dioxygenase AlkB, partial [Tanacetum coccineum]
MLGGHLDDMEADWSKPIVSMSLGCKAIFLLGGKSRNDEPLAMFLRSGDIVLMSGEARKPVSEDISHVLFRCDLASCIFRRICRWWELDSQDLSSFADWDVWFSSIRRPSKSKVLLEGVFFVAW